MCEGVHVGECRKRKDRAAWRSSLSQRRRLRRAKNGRSSFFFPAHISHRVPRGFTFTKKKKSAARAAAVACGSLLLLSLYMLCFARETIRSLLPLSPPLCSCPRSIFLPRTCVYASQDLAGCLYYVTRQGEKKYITTQLPNRESSSADTRFAAHKHTHILTHTCPPTPTPR